MPKKDEVKIPKKVKEEMTEEIIKEISTTVKSDVTEDVVNDIKKSFNQEFKDGIKESIKEELIDDIKRDISKEQKKLSRSKSFKIFRLYIYLIVVVAALVYILFRLYETDNLTVIDKAYTRRPTSVSEKFPNTTTTTEKIRNSEYYINTYGYLMDNVRISNVDLVKGNTDVSDISIEDKLVMAYNMLDDDNKDIDGIIITIREEDIIASYENIFGSIEDYKQSSFAVNGLSFAYSSSNNSYMAIGEESISQSYINNILIDGHESNGIITLEAKTYVVKNAAVYSPSNLNSRITNATDDMDLTKFHNRLLSVEYKFAKNGTDYNLVSISKK